MLDRDRLLQASGGHLSLIGHITQRELAESLHRTDAHNGFANRCLWAIAQRSQCLPDGGNVDPQQLSAIARSQACRRVGTRPDRNPVSPRPGRKRTLE